MPVFIGKQHTHTMCPIHVHPEVQMNSFSELRLIKKSVIKGSFEYLSGIFENSRIS